MSIKVAINGFGRIGRASLRSVLKSSNLKIKIAAINDLTEVKTLAHLFQYDSVFGKNEHKISSQNNQLIVQGNKIPVFSEKDPAKLPWKKLKIDLVLECTGFFRNKLGAEKHLQAGAQRVIISAPPQGMGIPTFVLGVNEKKINFKKDLILSNGSCTTNCLAPVAKVLHHHFKIKQGLMTTIHSYTSNQNILDAPHKDLRRARAAAENIIPTTTGATQSVVAVIPELKGKLTGLAIRVPTPNVSLIDFVALLEKTPSLLKVKEIFKNAAKKELKGILDFTTEPLVSTDFIANPFSAVIDFDLIEVKDKLVKIIAWYDNEYAYACRLVEMADYLATNIK
jgi:glyceraldehyde-3-phosphate dehydrogenase type I